MRMSTLNKLLHTAKADRVVTATEEQALALVQVYGSRHFQTNSGDWFEIVTWANNTTLQFQPITTNSLSNREVRALCEGSRRM